MQYLANEDVSYVYVHIITKIQCTRSLQVSPEREDLHYHLQLPILILCTVPLIGHPLQDFTAVMLCALKLGGTQSKPIEGRRQLVFRLIFSPLPQAPPSLHPGENIIWVNTVPRVIGINTNISHTYHCLPRMDPGWHLGNKDTEQRRWTTRRTLPCTSKGRKPISSNFRTRLSERSHNFAADNVVAD